MQILVLNGSPRPHGNTAAMVAAFRRGAEENGHVVTVVNVCRKKISGCLACESCHQAGSGHKRQCAQKDDMQVVYPLLDEAEMIVLASPVYYHGFSGQLQCAINHIYALDKPKNSKRRPCSSPPAATMYTEEPSMGIRTPSSTISAWRAWAFSPPMISRISPRRSWRSSINLAGVWPRTRRRFPLPCLSRISSL